MSLEPYLDGVAALHALARQTEQAIQDAQVQPGAVQAAQQMRSGDQAVADGRDRMIAAVTRSKETLQSMGLKGLPSGAAPLAVATRDCADADQALAEVNSIAVEATRLSVAQADAVSEYRRLVAAAAKAEAAEEHRAAEERRLAAEAKARGEREARARAEQERREREEQARRDAERTRLRDQLKDLHRQRDQWANKMWRPAKKREVARLDGAIAELKARIAQV